MDREYESSDDEGSENSDMDDAPAANGTSHRFQERNDDDDGDEEGMVADEEGTVVVNGVH